MKSIQNDTSIGKKQLRYRKKERTKKEILTVAEKFYSEKSINEVLLEDIAEAAFVSRTTIYNYFKNKDDVLFAKTFKDGNDNPIILKILRDTFNHLKNLNLTPESIAELIAKKIGQSTLNNLIEDLSLLEDFKFEKYFEEPHFFEFFIQLLRNGELWVKAIRKGKKDKTIKNDLEDVSMVLYMTMLINGLLSEMELRRISSNVMGIEEKIITSTTLNLIALFLEHNVPSLEKCSLS
jgi:AcrR family transcriptional regulator